MNNLVTQQKALEVAILLHADKAAREKLITIIQHTFNGRQAIPLEYLLRKLEFVSTFDEATFQIDVNYYGLCLRLEMQSV